MKEACAIKWLITRGILWGILPVNIKSILVFNYCINRYKNWSENQNT
jgi:hypothetical protein